IAGEAAAEQAKTAEKRESVQEYLKTPEIELCLGKQIAGKIYASHDELAHRVAKLRRKFAQQYGFVVPEIKLVDSVACPAKSYQIRLHGVCIATQALRLGEVMVVVGDGRLPEYPGDETREPAFGMKAMWIPETFAADLRQDGFQPIDTLSLILTHLSEVIRNNLAQLLSYKDMRALLDRLEPEYKRLIDDICPAHISQSGLQAILKLLLAERVSIRNLGLVLEAVAEIVPHVRRSEQVAEHVRMRMAQQICGDLAEDGVLKVLRLGNRWDLAFHQSLKRDQKGEVLEFDIDPRMLEQFGGEVTTAVQTRMDQGHQFVVVAAAEARPYVRMVVERLFPTLPVLSHLEIARGIEIKSLGAVS
ncbi:MAG TPA: FHIPEP family type III secretion protein, partial [Beijerinckiaceae bacterium]